MAELEQASIRLIEALTDGKLRFEKILDGKYLSSANHEYLDKLDKDSKKAPNEERVLLAQVILVAAGFLVAFIGAIRVPAG